MAQDESGRLLSLLTDGQDDLVARWIRTVTSSLAGRLTPAEVQQDLTELYRALLVAVREGGTATRGEAFGEVRSLLTELSRNRARQGFSPTETAISLFALKEVLEPALVESADVAAFVRFSRVLDDLGLYTVEVHAKTREEIISAQAEQLLELSTPVVKLWDGIVGVPLVGTLDSARTQVVMEKLLQSLLDQNATHAIVDITGVPSVDTQVAQHLLKTVVAARMMGAECTISGIRPQIAQTIVALGIEFGDITTKATLADALRHALHRIEQTRVPAGIGGQA
ncbi:STAS domain-containing protein [Streptomyces cocklensis]|jgi:rsbT co-antagonist protein RsbR|uniref:RsbR, positive regulator of sigma-B n=1 Tax=Actinacidiphila cocklensis TaxID=887465 RepID=A0A9W4GW38_9ACTN|nr:STAS domain-containing protein [Actinacidiphila cocklensis]MDD1058773.1 STAS domain-containing protein [Actinacidiphila cocklensis]WSX75023.1 STAS domain-containing protein [Streptomyces sp. NBC_00899]CAG6398891.1 RsbR, positive regulator of sigma-B [Actinacidiphila cocklensis]